MLNAKTYSCLFIAYLLIGTSFAQPKKPSESRLWKLNNYSGTVGIRGFYREQYNLLKNGSEKVEDFFKLKKIFFAN